MECLLLGLDLPASVGFIVWVLGFGPKSWGSVWLSVSEGLFIYYGLGFFTLALI